MRIKYITIHNFWSKECIRKLSQYMARPKGSHLATMLFSKWWWFDMHPQQYATISLFIHVICKKKEIKKRECWNNSLAIHIWLDVCQHLMYIEQLRLLRYFWARSLVLVHTHIKNWFQWPIWPYFLCTLPAEMFGGSACFMK